MKFKDLVYYRVMQVMYKAKTKSLPNCVQEFFSIPESKYNFRDKCKFTTKSQKGNQNEMYFC